MQAFEW